MSGKYFKCGNMVDGECQNDQPAPYVIVRDYWDQHVTKEFEKVGA